MRSIISKIKICGIFLLICFTLESEDTSDISFSVKSSFADFCSPLNSTLTFKFFISEARIFRFSLGKATNKYCFMEKST